VKRQQEGSLFGKVVVITGASRGVGKQAALDFARRGANVVLVAQEGLDNIANGPLWIVSTKGNIERARQISVVDGRAQLVRSFAIPPRDQMADLQRRQSQPTGR
jgi:NAD(P)-dependent dehydrogenase (short-subunit alcohol dehydrogenase family)